MRLNVQVKGVAKTVKNLETIRDRAKNWLPIAHLVHDYLLQRMGLQFDTEGVSEGKRWPNYSLEPKYALYKRAVTGHGDLLRWEKGGEYEMLYPSLTQGQDPLHIWRQENMRFTFGTQVPHASQIEMNTLGPFGEPSPARDFSTLGQETERGISNMITDWILLGQKG